MAQTSQTEIVKRIVEITEMLIEQTGRCTAAQCSQEHNRQHGIGVGASYIKNVWALRGHWDICHEGDHCYVTEKMGEETPDDTTDS